MEVIQYIAMLLVGIGLGAVVVWLILRAQIAVLNTKSEQKNERLDFLEDARQKLSDTFKALATDTLQNSNKSFLELAEKELQIFHEAAKGDLEKRQTAISELVNPMKESLGKVDNKLQEIEKARLEAYTSLTEQVKSMRETQDMLRGETSNLVKALRSPQTRGLWGEMQLRRVVDMAGMKEHCDYDEQQSVDADEGRLRPDMTIHLAGGKSIVVDAKTPLAAYLDAIETTDDDEKKSKLQDHARQVREHVLKLGKKSYYDQFDATPDFVVLFLPGEVFLAAACDCDPSLIEFAIEQNVMLATPTTLISLLRAAAYGWRQELLAENAQKISNLGRELYDRLATLTDHVEKVGKGLNAAIDAYNKAVGSLENRVLISARKFKELGAAGAAKDIEELAPVETSPRQIQAPELLISNDRPDEPAS